MDRREADRDKWVNVRRKSGIWGPAMSYCAHFSVLKQYDGQVLRVQRATP